MALSAGTRVGPYEVVSRLGAGGMGEVYRAHDTRLHRSVAIKVLRDETAIDHERLQRFIREAQSLAALNHPHIAQIYGLEDGALVMELVEGEDLSARLERGAIVVDESIAIAKQIAEALESAHDAGIMHRDLKPANVKVRADGTVKVLDFGLAKAFEGAGDAAKAGQTAPDIRNSPTITSPAAMTAAGVILGTAAYMSPEQARGRPVDKRADIWAFGVVLYEMLSGARAFAGDTVTDVLAAVVTREPDWKALPPATPPRIRELLARCLAKDHRLRLRDIGEARIALNAPDAQPWGAPTNLRPATHGRLLTWSLAAVAVVAAAGAWMLKPTPAAPMRKTELLLPGDARGPTLSPDGESVAYFARGRIWVRDLDSLEPRDIAAASMSPRSGIIWSPDSAFVGYNTADGRFWVIDAGGGTPLQICAIPETGQLMGAAWRRDGTIVLAVWRGNLYVVSATGGEPRAMVTIDPSKEVDFHVPVALPDGRVLVATHLENAERGGEAMYLFEVIDGSRREPVFRHNAFQPVGYVDAGYLLTTRNDANQGVWSFPYRGQGALRLEDAVLVAPGAGSSSADHGNSLLYSLAPAGMQVRELAWVDRGGRVIGQIGSASDLSGPALSPDGTRVAFSARVDQTLDIWVRDVRSGADSRFSFEADDEGRPLWFPSGRRVAYRVIGARALGAQLVTRDVGGTSERKDLVAGEVGHFSRDGRFLAFVVDDRGRNRVRYATLGADGELSPAVALFKSAPEPDATAPTFSPDGRLIAFVERQPSGNMEVFVTRFPSGEGRLQVSAGGGRAALWAANGELFYLAGSTTGPKQMVAVRIDGADTLRAGVPQKLFDLSDELDADYTLPNFDVTSDGKQFLIPRRTASAGPATRWVLVQNWRAEFSQAR